MSAARATPFLPPSRTMVASRDGRRLRIIAGLLATLILAAHLLGQPALQHQHAPAPNDHHAAAHSTTTTDHAESATTTTEHDDAVCGEGLQIRDAAAPVPLLGCLWERPPNEVRVISSSAEAERRPPDLVRELGVQRV